MLLSGSILWFETKLFSVLETLKPPKCLMLTILFAFHKLWQHWRLVDGDHKQTNSWEMLWLALVYHSSKHSSFFVQNMAALEPDRLCIWFIDRACLVKMAWHWLWFFFLTCLRSKMELRSINFPSCPVW